MAKTPSLRGLSNGSDRPGRGFHLFFAPGWRRWRFVAVAVLGGFVLLLGTRSGLARAATSCTGGTTLNAVAHEDDDLLFLSPDLLRDVQSGDRCVVTVFVTAGDNGQTADYWLSREAGSRAAYAQMAGVTDSWTTGDAGIPDHPAPVFTLDGDPNISLAFLRLPDGYTGTGFEIHNWESLQKLWQGNTEQVHAVDDSSAYSKTDLVGALGALLTEYQPDKIRTLDYRGSFGDGDHSDHYAVGKFINEVQITYTTTHTITGYVGYRSRYLSQNVFSPDLEKKQNAFYAYANHDWICNSTETCSGTEYADWLERSYVRPVANAGPDQTVEAGLLVTLDGSQSSDPDGDTLTYTWVQTGGIPTVSLDTADPAKPTFTAPVVGTALTFKLTVSDGTVSDSSLVKITVTPISKLSITKSDGTDTVDAGSTVTYSIVAANAGPSDASGAVFKDAAANNLAVSNTACGSATGGAVCPADPATTVDLMQGTGIVVPTLPSGGSVTFTVRGTVGGGAQIANTATLDPPSGTVDPYTANNTATDTDTVNPVSNLSITKSGGAAAVDADSNTAYTIRVTNSGPSPVTGAVLSDPSASGLAKSAPVCSAAPGQCTPATTPSVVELEGGSFALPTLASGDHYEITVTADVTATSGEVSNTASVAVPVGTIDRNAANNTATDTDTVIHVPVANAGPGQTVNAGETVRLNGSNSTDSDGDALTYEWTQTGAPAVTLIGADTAAPTFSAPAAAAKLFFTLKVTNSHQMTATDTVTIAVNHAPVANAGPDQIADSGTSVQLDGSASSDPDSGNKLSYKWEQTGGATVALSSDSASKPTFAAPATPAYLAFNLTVSDGMLTSTDTVAITAIYAATPAVKTQRRPQTKLVRMRIRHAKQMAFFRFSGSGGTGKLRFECRLDSQKYSSCRVYKSYKHLKRGRHVFRVRARSANGLVDLTPLMKRFRI